MTKVVYIADYNPYGDGVTSDYNALCAARDAAGSNGKVILEGGGKKYFVGDNDFHTGEGVTFVNPGSAGGDNYYGQAWADSLGGLTVNPDYQIYLYSRAGLHNVTIVPKGMIFPQTNADNWVGCPLTTNTGWNEVDVELHNTLVMGFEQAFYGLNCPRVNMDKFMFDCKAGIVIDNAGDTIRLNEVHGWPWATVSGPLGSAGLTRPGIAFEFKNNTDGGTVTNSFSTDYAVGVRVADLNGLRFIGHGAEAPTIPTSTGYLFEGSAENIELNGCQGAGLQNAIVSNTDDINNIINVNGGLWFTSSDNHFRSFKGTIAVQNANLQHVSNQICGLVGTQSRIILKNNIGKSAQLAAYYNGASSSQLIASGNELF